MNCNHVFAVQVIQKHATLCLVSADYRRQRLIGYFYGIRPHPEKSIIPHTKHSL